MPNPPPPASLGRAPDLEACLLAGNEVTTLLASARNLVQAAPDLLRALGPALGCDAGTVYVVEAGETEVLRAAAFWSRSGVHAPALEAEAATAALAREVGLPGEAWARRVPVVVPDLPAIPARRGADALRRDGFQAVVEMPLRYGEHVYGVLEAAWRHPGPPDPTVLGWLGQVGQQVGQFVAHEEAVRGLLAHKRRLDDLFENAPVGLQVLDPSGTVVRANRRALDKLGTTREECLGRPWRDLFVDPSVADGLLAQVLASSGEEEIVWTGAEMKRRDGAVRWIRINANARRHDGRPVEIRAFLRDETDVRRALAAARESEERYRRLADGAQEYALHTLDGDGRVTGWNSGAQRLFGWEEAEIAGRDFGVSFTPEDRADGVPARLLRLAADEGRFHHEGWRVRKDGARFWADVVYSALRDPAGRLLEVSQLTRDTSERRRLEALRRRSADLEAANRQVVEAARRTSELVRAVTRAVEQPLASIETTAAALRAQGGPVSPHVAGLSQGVAGLREAVRSLAALAAHPDRGATAAPVDLSRLVLEVRDLLAASAAERQVRVDCDVEATLGEVQGDAERLRQVLYNLLSNAIRLSRERGRVSVRVLPEGESRFRIEVEDSGIGLSDEEIAAMVRGPEGDGDDDPAGLGLAASRRIVEQEGGRLGVQSTPGRGSVFLAVLPRAPAGHAEAPLPDAPAVPRPVLAVSEDSSTRASVSWTLGSAGYAVSAAVSPEEGLDLSREHCYDVVVLDLRMGGMSPAEFVATLRGEGASRNVPCVVAVLGSREHGLSALLASDVLPRPAPADRLFAALEQARVPRGRGSRILVVDGDLAVCKAACDMLQILGYTPVPEPDGHSALRTVSEELPAAVVLSPFPLGMDVFAFLSHLRRQPGAAQVPVVLTLPSPLSEEALASLEEAAAESAGEVAWHHDLAGLARRCGPQDDDPAA